MRQIPEKSPKGMGDIAMTDNRTNEEFVVEFMTMRRLMHQMFVVNGLRQYAEMVCNPENAHLTDWIDKMPLVNKDAWLAAAADYVREYDDKYKPKS